MHFCRYSYDSTWFFFATFCPSTIEFLCLISWLAKISPLPCRPRVPGGRQLLRRVSSAGAEANKTIHFFLSAADNDSPQITVLTVFGGGRKRRITSPRRITQNVIWSLPNLSAARAVLLIRCCWILHNFLSPSSPSDMGEKSSVLVLEKASMGPFNEIRRCVTASVFKSFFSQKWRWMIFAEKRLLRRKAS